jgi:assimilatory nitrate reductase electron transfer subunit
VTAALRVVTVGYGPVGARFVEELLPAVRSGDISLTVIGAEPTDAYNRVLLAEYAAGRTERDALSITDSAAAIEAGVRILTGVRVIAIDRGARTVSLSTGEKEGYDRLVLAVGARAAIPTLDGVRRAPHDRAAIVRAGADAVASDPVLPAGIVVLRSIDDADRVRTAVFGKRRIVVLGAGVLGLEIALAAALEGADVCVVLHSGYPMGRNLDRGGGTVLLHSLRRAGITVVPHSRAESIDFRTTEDEIAQFDAVICADGKRIDGDLLLVSCGVRARTELAVLADLPAGQGILVDERLRSWGDDAVSAIGDCAHIATRPADAPPDAAPHGAPSGLIGPGWRQAEWLAAQIIAEVSHTSEPAPLAEERPSVVMLKAEDIDVVAVGAVDAEPWDSDPDLSDGPAVATAVSQWVDPEHGRYVKMVTRGGVLAGIVCIGMPRTGAELTLLFERGGELPADRSVLLRHDGPDYARSGTDGREADATVCWCNGVTAGRIRESATAGNTTLACVSADTRAGTGCGGCKGRVTELLAQIAATKPAPTAAAAAL